MGADTTRTGSLLTDIVVVGSGFGGSIMAMILRRLGHRVVLLERGRHPRFAIGESSSPLAGILIEQLAGRYDLPRLSPLASYGAWQRAYPHLTCGLKRGFTFFKHDRGRRYVTAPTRANQLLVAASPNDALADTHWLRSDVDAWLVQEAQAIGVELLDDTLINAVDEHDDRIVLSIDRLGSSTRIVARGLVDATGPRGVAVQYLGARVQSFADYLPTEALFTHFTGVRRSDGVDDFPSYSASRVGEVPPYPIDEAAVHHVFDGGWMWVLRFRSGVTSAGVALEQRLARELRVEEGAPAWNRLLSRFPSLATLFEDATPLRPFVHQPRLSARATAVAGRRWVALPSAAAFVDPLFSTGFPLTLLGIERLARLFEDGLFATKHDGTSREARAAYEHATLAEADHVAAFVHGCYAAFLDFERFAAYSMFYFAAASFAEASRRLRPPDERAVASPSFLGLDNAAFTASLRRLSPAHANASDAYAHGAAYEEAVRSAIEPLNVAGLCAPRKANWYGVEDADLVDGAEKLGVTHEAVRRMLATLTSRDGARSL